MSYPREDDEWDDDRYEPDDENAGYDECPDDEEEATVPCPFCRRQIHEDSVRCPYCEQYISEEDAPPARKPWWIIVGVILGLYAIYRWM